MDEKLGQTAVHVDALAGSEGFFEKNGIKAVPSLLRAAKRGDNRHTIGTRCPQRPFLLPPDPLTRHAPNPPMNSDSAASPSGTQTRHDMHGQWPQAESVEEIRGNLQTVRERIAAACRRVGRDPAEVRLLPVSKTKPESSIRLAYAAGCRMLGENKPQEAFHKWEATTDLADLGWSIIGHLQTNKAKLVARFASEFQALDSLRVAEALERRLQLEGRSLDVFVQVNTSGEASKYGLPPDEVEGFLRKLPAFSALRVRGLMTLAILSAEPARVRQCFALLRHLRDRLRQTAPDGIQLDALSMGMSGDYEIAIEEGATVVRVGQAIFGARATPDSHYWPDAGAADGASSLLPVPAATLTPGSAEGLPPVVDTGLRPCGKG